mmetsp:Transcript_230/g.975  ORF Transcript_230/g.975 Transcript_230/m.975 type:complete len:244 (-) Transcript_230:298-1029(-)
MKEKRHPAAREVVSADVIEVLFLELLAGGLVSFAEQKPVDVPDASLAVSSARESHRVVRGAEVEVGIRGVRGVPSYLSREVDDVGREHDVIRIVLVEGCGAGLVGVREDSAIRDFLGYPHRTLLELALADELHQPRLVAVNAREGLAVARVTVLLDEGVDQFDGVHATLGALQSYPDEVSVVHYPAGAVRVEFRETPERGFSHHHSVFVGVPHDVECLCGLGDDAEEDAVVPVPDLPGGVLGV